MISVIEQLKQQEIINSNIIKEIKDSINNQYPHYPPKQKAQIFANSIYHAIEESLPNYSTEIKKSIRNILIRQKLSESTLTISFQDVVESSIGVETNEELQPQLLKWLQASTDIDVEIIEKFVSSSFNMGLNAAKEVAVTSQFNVSNINVEHEKGRHQLKKKYIAVAIASLLIMVPLVYGVNKAFTENNQVDTGKVIENKKGITDRPLNEFPSYFQYKPINEEALRNWLNERNSKLADEPYFTTIISVADEYNLHPFLLFAITGQEQGFVPRTHKKAEKIANNPFNVFHSWEEYNTTISESSIIAAKTIINLSQERPEDTHPLQWVNRKYAEDPNWWKGVAAIFERMEKEVR